MRNTANDPYEFQGSTMYLRIWQAEEGSQESPVVVVEPGRRGIPFEYNRVALAEHIAETTGTTLDNMQWYEQSADGKLEQYQFKPYEVEHRPYANDLSRDEYESAEKKGHLQPDIIKGHHAVSSPVSEDRKEAVEAQVGEKIPSLEQRPGYEAPQTTQAKERKENQDYAQKQNQDFANFSFSHDISH